MAKNLLIVESPAKSRTLKKFLGRNFEIQATIGHIRDLPKSKLGVDPEKNFKIDYETIKGKEKVIKKLRESAEKAETIYLGPDPDREGEAIAWHVAQQLKGSGKITRVTFNEITKSAVLAALEKTREIDVNLVDAQQARRVLDRLVGYKVSPFLWKTVARGLSAGRVQSVALRIICEREAEIEAFKEEEYWEIEVLLEDKDKAQILSKLVKVDEAKAEIKNEDGARKIADEIKGLSFEVALVKNSDKIRKPSPPFITSTLQQEASRALSFSAKKTMMIAQQLYEGIELGEEGPTGLITYMRTDSTRVADSAVGAVREFIKAEFGPSYLPKSANKYGPKKGSQDAHEAIRPTYMDHKPDNLKKFLTRDQFRLYALIWNRFVASQMSPAVYDTTDVDFKAGRYLFHSHAQSLRFDGFLKVYQESKENGQNGENGSLDKIPSLDVGDRLQLIEINPSQHFTKPPARFTEATLVKTLEADGIGRPSTYATIISTLLERKYVESKERRLFPTDLGKTVNKVLIESFPSLFEVKFTARMEADLDKVEIGKENWVDVVREFYSPFEKTLKKMTARQEDIKESLTESTKEVCENCGAPMVIKWGRNGRFLACSSYPECRTTKSLNPQEAPTVTDLKCENCGAPMVVKTGRFGKFLACSAYPECKTTMPLPTGAKCPKEGCGGDIVQKQSKRKKLFYGCSNYPKCDFVSWDKPVNQPCAKCGNKYLVEKYSQKSGAYMICPVCKGKVAIEKREAAAPTPAAR
jgi:DNA topoisomerase-1